jgi:hypothetical protein
MTLVGFDFQVPPGRYQVGTWMESPGTDVDLGVFRVI